MPKKTGSYERMARLESIIKDLAPVVVLFSGGSDSSFLLWVCARILPVTELAALTFGGATISSLDLQAAQATAAGLRVKHWVCPGPEMKREEYLVNDLLRCYYCKRERFSFLLNQPAMIPGAKFIEGSVLDDLQDDRPGMQALGEAGIYSPLLQAGISKSDIGIIAAEHNLYFLKRRSDSCLATRVKTGYRLEIALLDQIRAAEDAIQGLGFDLVRARWQGGAVRLEFAREDLNRAFAMRQEIIGELNQFGFQSISIDRNGYKMSSIKEEDYE